jgi:hypothetical protein
MILINPSLAHAGTVALKTFYGLIRLKRFCLAISLRTVQLAFSSMFSMSCMCRWMEAKKKELNQTLGLVGATIKVSGRFGWSRLGWLRLISAGLPS